ncbi:hypothetical protein BKA83DRAFT_4066642, partial [Pisolithus microcarpus]
VITIGNGQSTVDIVVSWMLTALSPIFQFHSTVIMNFVSANTIFSSYPSLTLQALSIANVGPLYYSRDNCQILQAMQKYVSRNIRYI